MSQRRILRGKGEGAALASMHPEPSGGYVRALDADFPELGERALLNIEAKALDERKRALDSAIKARIGDARGIETESVRCTWLRGESERLDAKAMAADNPGIAARYMKKAVRDGGLRLSPARG